MAKTDWKFNDIVTETDMNELGQEVNDQATAIGELHASIEEINLEIPDGSISDEKIGERSVTDTIAASGGADTLSRLFSKLGNMIKGITGKGNWYTPPVKSIEQLNAEKLALTGGLLSGALKVSTTGKEISAGDWADLSSNSSGYALWANNAFTGDPNKYYYAVTHASIGARGIRLSATGNNFEFFDTGFIATVAGQEFTPVWRSLYPDANPVANRVILRDAFGRAKVAAPVAADDIARLDTVQGYAGNLAALNTSNKSTLVAAINELFTSASNGKTVVAQAITAKGVAASSSDTYAVLASKIGSIPASAPDWIYSTGNFVLTGLNNVLTSNVDTPLTVAVLEITRGGTFKFEFNLWTSFENGSSRARAWIYRNGSPAGVLWQTTPNSTPKLFVSETLSFNTGDKMQLMLWRNDIGYSANIDSFLVKTNVQSPYFSMGT
ncbi:hypothetical protein [Paenibacillus sp. FSL H8-0537]|uniref:hypothetical protein n=1 Tax=Paenibacillus sp. FSL H8-0537 TaxID=2921399 RepID=UPI003100EF08